MSQTSNTTKKTADYVHLHFKQGEQSVVVTPSNQDRFMVKVEKAIELLRESPQRERFHHEFNVLLTRLASWLNDRTDIQQSYLTFRDGSLAFIVMRNSASYDGAFEDSLSDLDIEIANDPDLESIDINMIGLPLVSEEAIESFLHSGVNMKFAPDGK